MKNIKEIEGLLNLIRSEPEKYIGSDEDNSDVLRLISGIIAYVINSNPNEIEINLNKIQGIQIISKNNIIDNEESTPESIFLNYHIYEKKMNLLLGIPIHAPVSISVVCALSDKFEFEYSLGSKSYKTKYENGTLDHEIVEDAIRSGYKFTFTPNRIIFDIDDYTLVPISSQITDIIEEIAYLNSYIKFNLTIDEILTTFHYRQGLHDFLLKQLNRGKDDENKDIFSSTFDDSLVKIDLAFVYTNRETGNIQSYYNNIILPQGGDQLNSFLSILTFRMNQSAEDQKIFSLFDPHISSSNIKKGLFAIISIKQLNENSEFNIFELMEKTIESPLKHWLSNNSEVFKGMVNHIMDGLDEEIISRIDNQFLNDYFSDPAEIEEDDRKDHSRMDIWEFLGMEKKEIHKKQLARIIPDAKDGLKTIHRRILWAMHTLGIGPKAPHKKCARIYGEVTGNYHSVVEGVYEKLVQMAQGWIMRYPLIESQGNFGSIDGYPPAAMRYTEARLSKYGSELFDNISHRVVEYVDNFDGTEKEPIYLLAKIPHLLLNGSFGEIVGSSSCVPSHNLTELLNACIAIIDNPKISIVKLNKIVIAPDFPTGGTIIGLEGIKSLFKTGSGSIKIRSKTHLEISKRGDTIIVVDEIPYLENKVKIIQQIEYLMAERNIFGIREIRDLSKVDSIRIEISLEIDNYNKDEIVPSVQAQLFKKTNLEIVLKTSLTAMVNGNETILNLKDALNIFLEFREQTIKAIAEEELEKVNSRLHILEGLVFATDNIEGIINLIKTSGSNAKQDLMTKYDLSELQALAILDFNLGSMATIVEDNLGKQQNETRKIELELIIKHRSTRFDLMKVEFQEILKNSKDVRRTDILENDGLQNVIKEPLPLQMDILITSTSRGYIRAINYKLFIKTQNRVGRGIKGLPLTSGEILLDMRIISNRNNLLLLTENVNQLHESKKTISISNTPAYKLPHKKSRISKGSRLLRQMPHIEGNVMKIVNVSEDNSIEYRILVIVTNQGFIQGIKLNKFGNIWITETESFKLGEDDIIADAFVANNKSMIFIATKNGNAVLCEENTIKTLHKDPFRIRILTLTEKDEVVSAFAISKDNINKKSIFTLTNKGKGKRTTLIKYKISKLGAKGTRHIKLDKQFVVSSILVDGDDQSNQSIFVINSMGVVLKFALNTVRNTGLISQGVKIMQLKGDVTMINCASD